MLAAKAGGFRVAGAFYVPIETTVKRAALGDVDIASEKFGYKCKGIFDGRYAGHIDRTVQSRWSRYYNFGVSKDDGQYGYYSSSGAMKPEDFEKFISITEQKVCEIAGQVAAGNIDVSPYRLNNNIPCGWCKYRSVCRFDWQVNKYRELQTVDKVDFLKSAEGGDG
jgi:ATP-dependent helicase/DNAse subunit B